ncbi:MAG TPA: tRNA preQ1(34) S-adenosylmethionine ribosyltransferase-isomerase QueA [Pyrinomonadaceae bacterium]|nr:tRNA preQ1(34) S-adenosylmethionine ribosyltransferase-isomerase QueA [Pyrinomonadaceae bacterium]
MTTNCEVYRTMLISDFDYDLPEELIAQAPLPERDASRMLVLDRRTRSWTDSTFHHFIDHITAEDVVVLNNTRVIPARLIGKRRSSGGRVEVFLVRKVSDEIWEALVRPGSRLKPGVIVDFGEELSGEIIDEPGTEIRHVRFTCEGSFEERLAQVGVTPLPPYIKRISSSDSDRERYQTVYARTSGAIAAPTAGLHFTNESLTDLRAKAHVAEITLHVGYGTFEPVRVDEVSQHVVSSERYEIDSEDANAINDAKTRGGRVIAVGTTTVRTLESAVNDSGQLLAQQGESKLTITPGYKFRVVDALLTNFHLPRSSLLLLVSAFAGREFTLGAYKHAVDQRYRFYSYGDCMLIL